VKIIEKAIEYTNGAVPIYVGLGGNNKEALEIWEKLYKFIPMLFKEPNPVPLKYYLRKLGLINSSEVRSPLVEITGKLQEKIDTIRGE